MTKQERNAGVLILIFGLAVAAYSMTALSLGSIKQPGPGMFPLICGVGIVFLCGLWLIRGNIGILCSEPLWREGNWKSPAVCILILLVYTALMEDLGYLPSTLLFLVAWQILIERANWRRTVIIAIIGTTVMYLLFVYLLSVALPMGILER